MKSQKCISCGKEKLSKEEVGLSKKLINEDTKYFYCLDCLSEQLEIEKEFLLVKIEEYKDNGCILF